MPIFFGILALYFTSLSASQLFAVGNPLVNTDTTPILISEFIYQPDDVSFPSCHASTIVEVSDGLLAAWFGGTYEKHPDVGIWLSSMELGSWSKPVEVANGVQNDSERYPTWNPVLFNSGSEILLFYKVGPSPSTWWGEVLRSSNRGVTWSVKQKLPLDIFGPIRSKPISLTRGILLCPSSTEDEGWRVHMEITRDLGHTWERTPALNDGVGQALIQPTILVHQDSHLQILCRSKQNFIFTSWSSDGGQTWGDFDNLGIPNPNAGVDAVTLRDGRHVLIYNHTGNRPEEEWGNRNRLSVAISDDGLVWRAVCDLENDRDQSSEYSYPAIIQTEDGMLHITYTWKRQLIKHCIIDPQLIVPGDRLN